MKLTKTQAHNYWINPTKENMPAMYRKGLSRSRMLYKHFPCKENIIELGCNIGRNLNYLYNKGVRDLYGIEINKEAIQQMKIVYPDLKAVIFQGAIEDHIKKFKTNQFNLLLTMAVFEHVHYESEWIFKEAVRVARKIITIEDEFTHSNRHFPRNYKKVFEDLGIRQVNEYNCQIADGLSKKFYLRIFEK